MCEARLGSVLAWFLVADRVQGPLCSAGKIRGPWTHRVVLRQAWLRPGNASASTHEKRVLRAIISDSDRGSSEDYGDDGVGARPPSTPVFVSASLSRPKEYGSSDSEDGLPLPVGTRCLLMGLRRQYGRRRYAVRLKCGGEHELRQASWNRSRPSESQYGSCSGVHCSLSFYAGMVSRTDNRLAVSPVRSSRASVLARGGRESREHLACQSTRTRRRLC